MGKVTSSRRPKNKNRIKSRLQHQPFQQTDIRSVGGGTNSSGEGGERRRRKRAREEVGRRATEAGKGGEK